MQHPEIMRALAETRLAGFREEARRHRRSSRPSRRKAVVARRPSLEVPHAG
jgi:hypothetical protein